MGVEAMNIFQAYERIEAIYTEYATKVNEFINYYKENAHKKNEACISMCNASIKYYGRHHSINSNENGYGEDVREKILEARALPSYNVCNIFAWMKRYKRLEREFARNYYQYRRAIKKTEKALDELKKQLTRKQLENKTLLERFDSFEAELIAEEFGGVEWEKEEDTSAFFLRSLSFEISKNDMLSLFSLRHEGWEKQYIDELPDGVLPTKSAKHTLRLCSINLEFLNTLSLKGL
jgi:hypothetical protein